MIRAVAIDDEANALGIIQDFASKIPDLELVSQFTNPVKGLTYIIGDPSINLVFLDIRMAKLSGIELAQKLPDNVKVVITSAYSDYAQMGFELDVIDYLLKPFSFDRFERAVRKARIILHETNKNETRKSSPKLVPGHDDIILVKAGLKTVKIRLNEITYIQGSGNYVTIHTIKSKIMVHNTMKRLEETLMPYQFVRVHKSYIISFLHIDSIGANSVTVNQAEIPISDTMKDSFQSFLDEHATQI